MNTEAENTNGGVTTCHIFLKDDDSPRAAVLHTTNGAERIIKVLFHADSPTAEGPGKAGDHNTPPKSADKS